MIAKAIAICPIRILALSSRRWLNGSEINAPRNRITPNMMIQPPSVRTRYPVLMAAPSLVVGSAFLSFSGWKAGSSDTARSGLGFGAIDGSSTACRCGALLSERDHVSTDGFAPHESGTDGRGG